MSTATENRIGHKPFESIATVILPERALESWEGDERTRRIQAHRHPETRQILKAYVALRKETTKYGKRARVASEKRAKLERRLGNLERAMVKARTELEHAESTRGQHVEPFRTTLLALIGAFPDGMAELRIHDPALHYKIHRSTDID